MPKNYFRVKKHRMLKRKLNNGVVDEGEECQKKTKVLICRKSENLIPSGSVNDTILPDNSVIEVDLYELTELNSATLEQGKRRLDRALKQRNVEITDAEQNAENEENCLLFLTEEVLNKELSDVPRMSKDIASTASPKWAKKQKKKQSKNEPQVPVSSTDVQMQIKNDIEELMEEKFSKMAILIEKKIDSAKRSILYDIRSKMDELRHAVFQNSISTASTSWLEVMKKGLNGCLPLKSLQNFIDFDEQLSGNEEYQAALIQLYKTSISSESSVIAAIKKIMKLTLEKAVEQEYSGTGRTVQGIVAKRNFSATATYKCLDGAVSERFAGSDELKNLSGKVGRWLSGAGDREGGRKTRGIK